MFVLCSQSCLSRGLLSADVLMYCIGPAVSFLQVWLASPSQVYDIKLYLMFFYPFCFKFPKLKSNTIYIELMMLNTFASIYLTVKLFIHKTNAFLWEY